MESSFTVARIKGIPVGAHWSWLFVFALVVWSLARSLFPSTYPGLSEGTYLGMGAAAGVLFFGSILLHEFGHALTALREGMRIDGITLWLFGGVARFTGTFPSPGAEFRIAGAGPLVSIALAVLFWLLSLAGSALEVHEAVVGVSDYLARINAIVVAFNLVPALPLDGGRILRSYLWRKQGDFGVATRAATRAGIGFGIVLASVGVLEFLTGERGGGSLWFMFLGWFLIQAAQSESGAALVQSVLKGRTVREFMTPDVASVPPTMTLDRFLDDVIGTRGHSTYPVLDGDRLAGLVSMRRAGEVPAPDRTFRTVADVMVPAERVAVLDPGRDMMDALFELQSAKRAPVVDDGRVVGFISLSDAVRAVEVGRVRGPDPSTPVRSSGLLVWVIVIGLILAAGAYLYHPPLVVLRPGTTLDVAEDITISGVPTDEVNGRYLLTSVRLERPNGLETLAAYFTGTDLMSTENVFPTGIERDTYFRQQQDVFVESQRLAAAAAAEAAGFEVQVEGAGAVVNDVVDGMPATDVLRPGDVIVEVDGDPIRLTTDLQDAIRSQPVGTEFELGVERGGGDRTVTVESALLPGAGGTVGIGVIISTRDFDIELPFEIDFAQYDIGGPSAGLVYALAITDMLDERDIADGQTVAATGTIGFDGGVGEVGGVEAKAAAVRSAGADIFLVPERESALAAVDGLRVEGVTDLRDALSVLEDSAS